MNSYICRCRPLNNAERDARSYSVVDCPNSREVSVKEKAMSSVTKTFQFDKVFGAQSKQIEVYRSVVLGASTLIHQVSICFLTVTKTVNLHRLVKLLPLPLMKPKFAAPPLKVS